MRVVLLFLFAGSAVAQEPHLSNQSAFSINPFFGRYNSENKLGARVAYALMGSAQVSYTYSTVLTNDPVTNFQNESIF